MAETARVYAELHRILAPFAATLEVKRDDGQQLYLDTRHRQKNGQPLFFGAVQVKKSSVAYHLMPVYLQPALLETASAELRARLTGQSCFHFKKVEPALFEELAALTQAGFDSYHAQGFVQPRPVEPHAGTGGSS
jgi:hypothetical protein